MVPSHLTTLLLLTLPFAACSPSDDFGIDDDRADQQEVCDPVSYDFEIGADQSDLTTKRVNSLNAYGQKKLASRQCDIDNTLRRRNELVEESTNISDFYRVEVGSVEQCLNGGGLFTDYDLATDTRYQDMKAQVDMSVDFLARLHEDTGGVPTVLFDRITICPYKFWGEEMSLAGQTLYVNPNFEFGGITTLDGRELRDDLWSPGELLNQMAGGDKLKLVWPLLDPGGTIRSSLRQGVAARIKDLAGKLGEIISGGDKSDPGGNSNVLGTAALISAIGSHVIDQPEEGEELSLKDKALNAVADATVGQVNCVAKEWKAYVEDSQAWTSASEAGVATIYKEAARNALNINLKQNGLIVVGNAHFINVNLDIFLSNGYQELERYVTVREVSQDIDVEQNGLIVIYTVDDVNVNLNVTVNKTLQSAGFAASALGCGLEI